MSAHYCPYGFPDDGHSCCGGYCGMDAEDGPPKTYTEAEVKALIAAARNDALREAKQAVRDHGYLAQIRIDKLEEAAARIDALIQEAPK